MVVYISVRGQKRVQFFVRKHPLVQGRALLGAGVDNTDIIHPTDSQHVSPCLTQIRD